MPAWIHSGLLREPYNRLHVDTEVKSHAAIFSRPSYRPNWNFTLGIFVHGSYVWTIFFHPGLKCEFSCRFDIFGNCRSEFYNFANYETIKQIAREKESER